MSIRLDPRRLGTLKRLAAEAGVRPGDLVRQWTEERIDADRGVPGAPTLADRVAALAARVEALEAASGSATAPGTPISIEREAMTEEATSAEAPKADAEPKAAAQRWPSAAQRSRPPPHRRRACRFTRR